jgi:hypothetical protein
MEGVNEKSTLVSTGVVFSFITAFKDYHKVRTKSEHEVFQNAPGLINPAENESVYSQLPY